MAQQAGAHLSFSSMKLPPLIPESLQVKTDYHREAETFIKIPYKTEQIAHFQVRDSSSEMLIEPRSTTPLAATGAKLYEALMKRI